MIAIILDGKALAGQIESEITVRVQKIKEKSNGRVPGAGIGCLKVKSEL